MTRTAGCAVVVHSRVFPPMTCPSSPSPSPVPPPTRQNIWGVRDDKPPLMEIEEEWRRGGGRGGRV